MTYRYCLNNCKSTTYSYTTRLMNIQEEKNILIISILDSLDIKPTKINDKQVWYHSPFREENTPGL